ncbi:hypothetical protein [Syntrophorhabdus aromaticivorans]|uniref:Uncharacterized protein n=1 Tax=Syntrophorhabdus aromaticivorans TaxID=328301 RepID=A0A971M6C8_9BACT|nr:hypothetical protein [Syntrophorhabdus aromaticivorans]NLW36614.1 hypothetical protein [Syntrophorhabdus aromaticivorans]
MEREPNTTNESRDRGIRNELLKFTGERLPQYKWLRNIALFDESPKSGQDG